MAYDDKCYDLAVAFLADYADLANDANRSALAQQIQDTIDEFIKFTIPQGVDDGE